jgi:CheY-like chemotaxis protein
MVMNVGTDTHSTGRHILVINDTPAIIELFTLLLEEEGYRVSTDLFTAEMGVMLARVKADRPELIVLDFIILDERRGWQFLELLKLDPATRDIPVIVCTAAVKMVEELQTHLQAMEVRVVLKPFDIEHLLGEIARVWAGVVQPEAKP